MAEIIHGDSLVVLKQFADNSIDSVVCDPPAGISFMGKEWDGDKGGRDQWIAWMQGIASECLRVLKPGGHALVWALPRTQHWTATAWENAGFEVRDCISYIFSTGFPKSNNIKKRFEKEWSCKLKSENVNSVIQNLFQNGEVPETDGLDSVVEGAWLLTSDGEKCSFVSIARDRSTLHHLMSNEMIEGDKALIVLSNAKQNGKEVGLVSVIQTSKAADSLDPTATLLSVLQMEDTDLSTISLWKQRLGDELHQTKTSITKTELETITGWKIWTCLPSLNTLDTINHLNHTALKPAVENWILLRKPLEKGLTIAANVLKWRTGALNIDATRVGTDGATTQSHLSPYGESGWRTGHKVTKLEAGRWPANLVHDGSEEALFWFPSTKVNKGGATWVRRGATSGATHGKGGFCFGALGEIRTYNDEGSAARYFYCAKPSVAEREMGLEEMSTSYKEGDNGFSSKISDTKRPRANSHPTVKALSLMRYLCRLITPPGGTVLDPFMGSGSTGAAAKREGFAFIGIEMDASYVEIARARIAAASGEGDNGVKEN